MVDDGSFYPIKSMKAEERLWWYSRFFDAVEVNSTFYAPLSAQNAVLWAKRTPPGFLFSVKAYALLTGHHLDAARLPPPLAALLPASARPNERGQIENDVFGEDAREWAFAAFREGLQPLADAGKLGYVLFQMAPWVKYGDRALEYLAGLPARLPGSDDRGGVPRRLLAAAAHRGHAPAAERARARLRLGGRAADARLRGHDGGAHRAHRGHPAARAQPGRAS